METQNRAEQPALFSEIPSKRFRPSRRRFRSRWATCVHEAAHAIVALWFRIVFSAATIRPSMGGVAGSLILNHETSVVPDGKSLIEVAAQLAVVMAAGYVGEKRWGFEPVNHDFVETSDLQRDAEAAWSRRGAARKARELRCDRAYRRAPVAGSSANQKRDAVARLCVGNEDYVVPLRSRVDCGRGMAAGGGAVP